MSPESATGKLRYWRACRGGVFRLCRRDRRGCRRAIPCEQLAPGSAVSTPKALYSSNGTLEVNFSFVTGVDSNGLTRYCYINPDTGDRGPDAAGEPRRPAHHSLHERYLGGQQRGQGRRRDAGNDDDAGRDDRQRLRRHHHDGGLHEPAFPRNERLSRPATRTR
jgi:hypothetical protein